MALHAGGLREAVCRETVPPISSARTDECIYVHCQNSSNKKQRLSARIVPYKVYQWMPQSSIKSKFSTRQCMISADRYWWILPHSESLDTHSRNDYHDNLDVAQIRILVLTCTSSQGWKAVM